MIMIGEFRDFRESYSGITHNQIDQVLVSKSRVSSKIDNRSLRGADFDTDNYLVSATIRKICF
jgi:hypothetical protein